MYNLKSRIILVFWSIVLILALFERMKVGYKTWYWIFINKSEMVYANTDEYVLKSGGKAIWYSVNMKYNYKNIVYSKKTSCSNVFFKKGKPIRVFVKKTNPYIVATLEEILTEIFTTIIVLCFSYWFFFKKFKKHWKEKLNFNTSKEYN
jgi:hypothetical protein